MEHFYATLLALFVSSVTVCFYIIVYRHRSHYKDRRLPPGNPGLPFVGESLEFLSLGWKGHPEKFIFDRIVRYSSEVFKTNIVGEPVVVLSSAAGNKFLFSNENKLVLSWWPNTVNKVFPSSRQTSSCEEAIRMRKILPQFMQPEALQRYIGIMDKIAQRHFSLNWENKKEVVVFPLAKDYTFWVACKVFMSIEDPDHIAEFSRPFNRLASGIMSIPIDLPGTPFNRAIKAANFIRKKLLVIIQQRKKEISEGKSEVEGDILSHMLNATEDMNEMNIADKILGLLIGGHDTASAACTFIVNYLSDLPHVYDAVYKEQMDIARSKKEGEALNWEDIKKMKNSWNVACEVMRLQPPLQGAFRVAITDFHFNGFSIPKGWKLYWTAHSTHRNPAHFPDPEKFDPTRFEGAGPAPYTYVPFGGGPRMCPGKEYARLEILVFMHNLVTRFKFEKVLSDEKIVVNPLPVPEKGLPVRLYPHQP